MGFAAQYDQQLSTFSTSGKQLENTFLHVSCLFISLVNYNLTLLHLIFKYLMKFNMLDI